MAPVCDDSRRGEHRLVMGATGAVRRLTTARYEEFDSPKRQAQQGA